MWGDSPTNSLSEGLDTKDEKPLIEIQDGGAPLAKHEDDIIEEAADYQGTQTVTIRTVKTIRTRIERHVGRNHNGHTHFNHNHTDSMIRPSTSHASHDATDDLFSSLNGFNEPMTYTSKASCEHLHPTDPVVQVAMESSFNERYDSMDQINIGALASRRFSGLDLLQSPYDAVSGEDIQRLLAWEDEMLPGWTRAKKSRDYEIYQGTAVDGGPPIIKVVITLKKMAYEEVVRRITDWKVRQEWDKTFDKITFIEQSYNFNVVHCSIKNQGLILAVLDDVDIDEPFHASVWSVADHPDSYSLSTGKPLRYETMIAGLVIRPLTPRDDIPWTKVTLLYQIKGSVSPHLRGTYLTGSPDKWIDMLKKYSPDDKKPDDKSPGDKKAAAKKPIVKKVTI